MPACYKVLWHEKKTTNKQIWPFQEIVQFFCIQHEADTLKSPEQ